MSGINFLDRSYRDAWVDESWEGKNVVLRGLAGGTRASNFNGRAGVVKGAGFAPSSSWVTGRKMEVHLDAAPGAGQHSRVLSVRGSNLKLAGAPPPSQLNSGTRVRGYSPSVAAAVAAATNPKATSYPSPMADYVRRQGLAPDRPAVPPRRLEILARQIVNLRWEQQLHLQNVSGTVKQITDGPAVDDDLLLKSVDFHTFVRIASDRTAPAEAAEDAGGSVEETTAETLAGDCEDDEDMPPSDFHHFVRKASVCAGMTLPEKPKASTDESVEEFMRSLRDHTAAGDDSSYDSYSSSSSSEDEGDSSSPYPLSADPATQTKNYSRFETFLARVSEKNPEEAAANETLKLLEATAGVHHHRHRHRHQKALSPKLTPGATASSYLDIMNKSLSPRAQGKASAAGSDFPEGSATAELKISAQIAALGEDADVVAAEEDWASIGFGGDTAAPFELLSPPVKSQTKTVNEGAKAVPQAKAKAEAKTTTAYTRAADGENNAADAPVAVESQTPVKAEATLEINTSSEIETAAMTLTAAEDQIAASKDAVEGGSYVAPPAEMVLADIDPQIEEDWAAIGFGGEESPAKLLVPPPPTKAETSPSDGGSKVESAKSVSQVQARTKAAAAVQAQAAGEENDIAKAMVAAETPALVKAEATIEIKTNPEIEATSVTDTTGKSQPTKDVAKEEDAITGLGEAAAPFAPTPQPAAQAKAVYGVPGADVVKAVPQAAAEAKAGIAGSARRVSAKAEAKAPVAQMKSAKAVTEAKGAKVSTETALKKTELEVNSE